MEKIIAFLLKKGYTQAPWDKCPQGFKESNYPCYLHDDYNVWIQLYPEEKYGHIYSPGGHYARHFSTITELKPLLPTEKVSKK